MFRFLKTPIEGVYVIEPDIYGDERGYFLESFNRNEFMKNNICVEFVQDNESKSSRGVLRGLHFQKHFPQSKLVRVIEGEVFDVAVDLRKNSSTYGKWFGLVLSSIKKNMLYIPKGFAHGFLCLSDTAIFSYKCDEFYHPEDEGGILWEDPDINIHWPIKNGIILSVKDRKQPLLKDCKMEFDL